jgi:hypothetical protein
MAYELDDEGNENAKIYLWRNRNFVKDLREATPWEKKRNLILIMGYRLEKDPTEESVERFIDNLSRTCYPARSAGIY